MLASRGIRFEPMINGATAKEMRVVGANGQIYDGAAAVVFICQLLLRPRLGHRHVWGLALILGIAYSWLRWGVWWMSKTLAFSYPEQADFALAMGLAVVVGATLGLCQRRQT